MKKNKIEKVILSTNRDYKPYTWADIKHIEFQDDDRIEMGHSEGWYSENNSMDPHFYVRITRMREETDTEFKERIESIERRKQEELKRRYETYLELKEEFENKSIN